VPEGFIRREAVRFKSTGRLGEGAIRLLLPDSIPAPAALDTLEAVQALLHRKLGYYSSRIASHRWLGSPQGGLQVRIDAGRVTRLGQLEVKGASAAEKRDLLELCPFGPGDAVTEKRVEKTLETITRFYAGRGYPFCLSRVSGAGWESTGGLALVLSIERGRFVRIGRIHIEGARQTRPEVVRRIAALAEGEPYDERKIERAAGRLLNSGLFSRASRPGLSAGADPALAEVHLSVSEFPAYSIEAALGSGGGGATSGVAGVVRIRLSNLFGTARAASINWQRPRKDWLSLQLAYREPWLGQLPIGLEAAFSQQVRDSLYTDTGGRIAFNSELTDRLTVGLGADYREASPGSETYLAAENSTFWAVTGTAAWSNITRPLNPASGFELSAKAAAGTRRTDTGGRRELRSMLGMSLYRPLARRSHIMAISAGVGLVSRGRSAPEQIPYHARIPIGGVLQTGQGATVRGHLEEEARGRRVGWVNLEYRYIIGENNRLFAFYDLGAAELSAPALDYPAKQETKTWRTEWLQGCGAGLQLESRLGLLQLSVAFTPERGLGEGRLHLSLAESF